MILVLGEDLVLNVYDTPADVQGDIEALDVEQAVLAMCDEHGQRYVVEWIIPNRHGRLLWLFHWSENGFYRLRPEGSPNPTAARAMIDRGQVLGRAGPFASLADVRAAITELEAHP